MCQRVQLEHRYGDPPGLLQPVLEVALGVLQSTGPHLGDPEVGQHPGAHLLAEVKFRGLGRGEQSLRLFGNGLKVVPGPSELESFETQARS